MQGQQGCAQLAHQLLPQHYWQGRQGRLARLGWRLQAARALPATEAPWHAARLRLQPAPNVLLQVFRWARSFGEIGAAGHLVPRELPALQSEGNTCHLQEDAKQTEKGKYMHHTGEDQILHAPGIHGAGSQTWGQLRQSPQKGCEVHGDVVLLLLGLCVVLEPCGRIATTCRAQVVQSAGNDVRAHQQQETAHRQAAQGTPGF
mmetsp:Transcript_25117/g.59775  ORF Transcript_25117/g.59775 Transcript_25117/m.59775 type:complete len:203 (-) Transcript_25117:1929-2537(-)